MPIFNPSMPSVPDGLHVDELKLDAVELLVTARTTPAEAPCPACGRTSTGGSSSGAWLKDYPPFYGRAVLGPTANA